MTARTNDLPSLIAHVLTAARTAEETAHGPSRRDAFRTTRYLLAGCRAARIPLDPVAALFHVRVDTIRTRSTTDGLVPAVTFAALAGIDLDDITAWQRAGRIPPASTDPLQRTSYPASSLIAALLTDHCTTSGPQL